MASQCCVSGELHQGTPAGNEQKIYGLDCYVTGPPEGVLPKGVVIILPDVFGWTLPNTRILADNYAMKGEWLVYLPDFMDGMCIFLSPAFLFFFTRTRRISTKHIYITDMNSGSYAPPELIISIHALDKGGLARIWHLLKCVYYVIPWRWSTRPAIIRPRVFDFFHELRKNEAAHLPLGAAGFCWVN
jgi:hypothetical protein